MGGSGGASRGIRQIGPTEDAICGLRDEVGAWFEARSEELRLVRFTYQFAVLRVIPDRMLCSLAAAAALTGRRHGGTRESQTEPDGFLARLTSLRLGGLRRLKRFTGLAVEPPGSLHVRDPSLSEPRLLAGLTLVALEFDSVTTWSRLASRCRPPDAHALRIRGRAKELALDQSLRTAIKPSLTC